jgi:hypothetical protein
MGTRTNAAILQIAAVPFTLSDAPTFREVRNPFNTYVKMDDRAAVDESTILWWMRQSEQARQALVIGMDDAIPEKEALQKLTAAYNWQQVVGLWSNGAAFDIPILQAAYERHGLSAPWFFRAPRDMRTILAASRQKKWPTVNADDITPHNALDDCVLQIRQLLTVHRG